jgi:membrane protein YdbS with pleckstrin-like domain
MSTEYTRYEPPEPEPEPDEGIPEGGLVIRQVQWAWVWSSMPWLVLAFILLAVGFLEEVLTTLFIVVIVVPRYFRWRRTEYVLTKETLFYQQGGVAGAQRYDIPISTLRDVRSRFGMFGRSLGYQTVDVMLDNGAVASLQYVSAIQDLGSVIRRLIDSNPPADDSNEPGEDGDSGNDRD